MLSEISQTRTQIKQFHLYEVPKADKSREIDGRTDFTRDWESLSLG